MLTLFRLLSRWPLGLLHAFGSFLGWTTWFASPAYRRRFRENVAQAGLGWSEVRPAIASAGRMVMELPWLWLRPAHQPLGAAVEWRGSELIEAAHRAGRGVLFLTPHLGSFEVTAQSYAERFGPAHGPITVLYRPARKAAIRPIVDSSRQRPGLATAPATLAGVRQMIRALRQGQAVGLLPDQVPPEGLGVWAPFFGRPAYTMTLAGRLAQQTGAAVLLAWGERLPRGRGYVVHVRALDEHLPPSGEDRAQSAAAHINRAMERLILQCPQQYLWGYHRYKEPRHEPAFSAGGQ
ncbi:lysophospholipid acyltransferase family protein [Aquabacterium sp. A7-Y]|uniref:lysophospholipid acyltransferase family protein n=1 Tax=Aquabacterium sp. A7-Y TaxID=1349605 RepID=UPI00223CC72E|nr:lysophospholipid acyltransferase family protein [Aquabacterium sp. A7-Y]MCW7539071.1 lysophospholipid acyltransferase family protein [Aquabacterium sp. A7-Y]